MDIENKLTVAAAGVEQFLGQLLSTEDKDLLSLYASMRYSALSGGKRIRPFLTLETAKMFGGEAKKAVYFAAALEMVHTYSLIHDDLPCMDEDDLRRGKPTNHKVYGEAVATLAGDALLTGAFELLCAADLPSDTIRAAVRVLSEAAGADGMVGGQIMDLAAENQEISFDTLVKLHNLKTGALITAAVRLGLLAAGVTDAEAENAVVRYAHYVGLAFQIVDDVLDAAGDEAVLGKTVGSDAEKGKVTFLHFLSAEEAMEYARRLTDSAEQTLANYENSETLCALARYLLERNH
ncbi:MAG: polyprenyl synthetase family protein [Clostridia bacterium]|nr:polyprenyl synthetase family protein [Clostridia bacterium]